MKEENLDIFVVDHISHFGKDPWIYIQSIGRVNRIKTKSQIRKEKIKRILCQS